jgi:hypothetical protein
MRDRFLALTCAAAVAALVLLPTQSTAGQSSTTRTATASTARASTDSALPGTWKLASWVRHMSNGRVLPYDPVVGILFYDGLGNMSVQIMATDPSNDNRSPAASAGAQRSMQNYTAYFGTYTIDQAKRTVTHHIRGNRSTGGAGRDAVRQFELDGDRLTLRAQADGLTHVLVWQRAK